MSRIATYLEKLKSQGRQALVTYLVAGDPDVNITVPAMHALVDSGADIIELGIPFSDPMAEGPAIQRGHERALAHGTSLTDAIAMVAEFRLNNQQTPIILMGYANPIEAMGVEAFCQSAATAGVDGVLTVDLPPEESPPLTKLLQQHELDCIYLVAPTTSSARARAIAATATGFLYYVSLKGVTGAASLDIESVKTRIAELRGFASLPICVGFGVKDAESARDLAAVADGVVVGSALVELFGEGDLGLQKAAKLVGEMRSAMDADK